MSSPSSTATPATRRSVARLSRLRQRLRVSGALPSSRSIMSRHEELVDEEVLDVGDGKHANLVEHLLARLEQHGLRRCFCAIEPASIYDVAPGVPRDDKPVAKQALPPLSSSRSPGEPPNEASHPDAREPFYYCCVPCEVRLTRVSSSAATMDMLEDAHHHFSSAAHRRSAALMGDPDIDTTLSTTPIIEQARTYMRIFVNGLPVLLSRRPGGGDLFYPLPFEEELCGYVDDNNAQADGALDDDDRPACYQDGTPRPRVVPLRTLKHSTAFWYAPTDSLFTRTRQIAHLDALARAYPTWRQAGLRQRSARSSLSVYHIPVDVYRTQTGIDPDVVPLTPELFSLVPGEMEGGGERRKASKRARDVEGSDDEKTASATLASSLPVYVQRPHPLEEGLSSASGPDLVQRCVVQSDGVYRVALVARAKFGMTDEVPASLAAPLSEAHATEASDTVPLTQEALRRHTQDPKYAPVKKIGAADTAYFTLSSRSQRSGSLLSSTASSASSHEAAASSDGGSSPSSTGS